ncbi:MAG TPA: DoxX-like family protein, partial [Chitinophagaceae bacterium]|nr:DoxX-like family protein [Chitinophagaceae bacterium]
FSSRVKRISLYVMTLFYIVAGLNHFLNTSFYFRIMTNWTPQHSALVYISGGLEIIFGLLLLYKPSRRLAAWGIIALLIAGFPANIQMFQNYLHGQS